MTQNFGAAPRALAALAAFAPIALGACSLDVTNPNAAPQQAVLSSPAGIRGLAVGLEGRFGNAIEHAVWVPGLVSGELGNTDASLSTSREFQKYPTASANAPRIEPTNPDLLNFWSRQFQVVRAANDILGGIHQIGNGVTLQPGTRSGIEALADALKANAYGTLIEAWQQVPLDPDAPNPPFADRATVLKAVLDLLASARGSITTTPPSAEFTNTVLLPGIDLPNTIRAWQARYALAAGQYEQALAFASEVPVTAASEFRYSTVDQNPLWAAIQSNRYFAAIASLRFAGEASDTRIAKFTGTTITTPFGGAQVVPIVAYRNANDPVPLFTQDEMSLIRAEAHARAGRLPQALAEINTVRRANGLVGIEGTRTQGQLLEEIFKQRTYSLFLTGLHWADERRFGRLDLARAAWLPYPAQETVANPNAPANP